MDEKKRKNKYTEQTSETEKSDSLDLSASGIFNAISSGKVKVKRVQRLLTTEQQTELMKNGSPENTGKNHVPVAHFEIVKLGYSFLLTELNPLNPTIGFGLCDYDTKLEFGTVNIDKLKHEAEKAGSELSSNLDFVGRFPLSTYAMVAKEIGTIVTDQNDKLLKGVFENFSKEDNISQDAKLRELKFF